MDLDAYVSAKRPTWDRLAVLSRRRRLSGAEVDEILDTYQRVATHLSVIRSTTPDAAVVGYLSTLLARARTRAAGTNASTWSEVGRYFARTFPAALYTARRWWIPVLLISALAMVLLGWWYLANPQVESGYLSDAAVKRLVEHDFADYYSENDASSFAFRVWTNNFFIAMMCIALGFFGIPVVWMIASNVQNTALTGSVMIRHGHAAEFFGLITPHGLLELTCLFVAAGVGLRLFWSWVAPGVRTRGQAVAEEGRAAIAVALGLIVLLLICGLIEAFVTPSGLPTGVRIGIGVAVWLLFWVYVFVLGRWAYDDGERGDIAVGARGYDIPMVG